MKALTAERLRELLSYNPATGLFTRNCTTGARWRVGQIAGGRDASIGYVKIAVDGQIYFAHRLAWLYVHGRFPLQEMDHVNGLRDDNRLVNLRECDRAKNGMNLKRKVNNTSGIPGVSLNRRGKWDAYIMLKRRKIYLGCFCSVPEAAAVRKRAELKYFGEFARG